MTPSFALCTLTNDDIFNSGNTYIEMISGSPA
jgi:hypothetical protein